MKTNGATWKAYLDSWPDGQWFEDGEELVNGQPGDDIPYDQIPNDATVEFTSGVVFQNRLDQEGKSLVSHFRRWLKAQTVTRLMVEIPKEREQELVDFLKSIGGRGMK